MKLSKAMETGTSTNFTASWLGYNHNPVTRDGEFYAMKNMTSDYYPLLSPRTRRGLVAELTNCTALDASSNLYWCDDNKFYFDTRYVCDLGNYDKHQFVRMGAYVCIFPDNLVYNTYTDEIIELEASHTTAMNPRLSLCKMDGASYDMDAVWIGDTAPEDKEAYPTWLDTSSTPAVLKIWSVNTGMWTSVPTTFVKIESVGIGENFKEDDAVLIEGCDIADFNTTMIINSLSDDFIVVTGLLDEGVHINSRPMTLSRNVPQMDYVCEHNNRLFGCSSENHEIYVCKQGDPTNWNYFGGLSSDSYAATIGTDGDFTGCIAHMGYVLFFKDKGVHKLYGDSPANFSLNYTALRGVQKGSERSLVVLNEMLFYKSNEGICVYDGSLPVDISDAFGKEMYFDAVAGGYKDKYYISMRDRNYKWYLYVYDTNKQMWHMEDNIKAAGFAYYDGGLYMCDQNNKMWVTPVENIEVLLFPSMSWEDLYYYPSDEIFPDFNAKGVYEDDVEWSAETGDLGLDNPYQKYVSRLILRLWMDEGAEFKVEIMYDSSGQWDELFNYLSDYKRSFNIPLRVTRCDHYRVRFSGKGMCKIYSLAQVIETGSEVTP